MIGEQSYINVFTSASVRVQGTVKQHDYKQTHTARRSEAVRQENLCETIALLSAILLFLFSLGILKR